MVIADCQLNKITATKETDRWACPFEFLDWGSGGRGVPSKWRCPHFTKWNPGLHKMGNLS